MAFLRQPHTTCVKTSIKTWDNRDEIWRQHHDSDRCAEVFIISFFSTVLLSLHHVADIVSWLLHVLTHAGVRHTLSKPWIPVYPNLSRILRRCLNPEIWYFSFFVSFEFCIAIHFRASAYKRLSLSLSNILWSNYCSKEGYRHSRHEGQSAYHIVTAVDGNQVARWYCHVY
jgi:hypothetical protein